MATYNGHKNWNHWNVALWIGNDEGLYNIARDCYRRAESAARAAPLFISHLAECGVTKTPDGAPYTVTTVTKAIAGCFA